MPLYLNNLSVNGKMVNYVYRKPSKLSSICLRLNSQRDMHRAHADPILNLQVVMLTVVLELVVLDMLTLLKCVAKIIFIKIKPFLPFARYPLTIFQS